VREHRLVFAIGFQLSRMFTDRNLGEFDFPDLVLAGLPWLSSDVLGYHINLYFSDFIDDFLDVEIQKPIKR